MAKTTKKTKKKVSRKAVTKKARQKRHDSSAVTRIELTVEQEEMAQRLAFIGSTNQEIAYALDVSEDTLVLRLERQLNEWRRQPTDNVLAMLYKLCMGDIKKTKEVYDEKGNLKERTVITGVPSLAAMKLYLYKRTGLGRRDQGSDIPDSDKELLKGPIVIPQPSESEWRETAKQQQKNMLRVVSGSKT